MQLGFSSCRKLAVCLSISLQLVVLGILDDFLTGYRLMTIGWKKVSAAKLTPIMHVRRAKQLGNECSDPMNTFSQCIKRSQTRIFASMQMQAARTNKRSTEAHASNPIHYKGWLQKSEVLPGVTPFQVAYGM